MSTLTMFVAHRGYNFISILPRGYRGPEPASEARTDDGYDHDFDMMMILVDDHFDNEDDNLEFWEEEER